MENTPMHFQLPAANHQDGMNAERLGVGGWALGVVCVALALSVLLAAQQPSEIQLVISGEPGTPPRYAVPDFVALSPDVADVAKMLGQVLWDDLNFEREFYMIPRDTYATIPVARTESDVPFAAWRELGADA